MQSTSRSRLLAACLVLFSAFVSCDSSPVESTQVLVTVYADPLVAAQLTRIDAQTFDADRVQDEVQAAGNHSFSLETSRPKAVPFPFSFGIQKRASLRFLLVMTGYENDTLRIEHKVLVRFEQGQVRGLRLYLSGDCYGHVCGDEQSASWLQSTCDPERSPICGDVFEHATEQATPGTELGDAPNTNGQDAGGLEALDASTAETVGDARARDSAREPQLATEAAVSTVDDAGSVADARLGDDAMAPTAMTCAAPCPPNSACDANSKTCRCVDGFQLKGSACESIDDCRAASCGQGNTCTDAVNDYSCTCGSGSFQAGRRRCVPRFTAVAAGKSHTCAVRTDGSVVCWGDNSSRQLGPTTLSSSPVPVEVTGFANAAKVAAGGAHTCTLAKDGSAWCWGYNRDGELGNGNQVTSGMPSRVVDLDIAEDVVTGALHSCARLSNGGVSCWGSNFGRAVGGGSTMWVIRPAVVGVSNVSALVAGHQTTCALSAGSLTCWGNNDSGLFCNGSTGTNLAPAASGPTGLVDLAVGISHACVRRGNGSVTCCGSNAAGGLGDGSLTASPSGTTVSALSAPTSLALGADFSCALKSDGTVTCWGDNSVGQLGSGSTAAYSALPVPVSISNVRSISAGTEHVCAVHVDGNISCWGGNRNGQLGNGTNVNASTPVGVTAY